jgi:AraC-like DNA-binding protein
LMSDSTPLSWLQRIAPLTSVVWRGRWQSGTVEPWRLLYDHELVLFEAGDCQVIVADHTPSPTPKPRHADPNRKPWHALTGRDAQALMAHTSTGTTIDCSGGSFLILPPDIAHLTVVTRGPAVRTCIHFDWLPDEHPPSPLCAIPPERPDPRLVRRAPAWIPPGLLHGRIRLPRVVKNLSDTIYHRWATRRLDERLATRATLLELLIRLLGEHGTEQASPLQDLAHAVKDRLDQHLNDPRALPDLLVDLDRSYEHCCRVFTATYGVPPLRYLTSARIEQAKHLLRQPHAEVAAIAKSVGYADSAYFSRVFKEQVGISPRQFRG